MNPKSVRGPLELFMVLLFSVLLRNFGLDILPILSYPTFDCTLSEADCELVTLFTIVFMDFTQGDNEGESTFYLD
jgi:hypothetical protein